MQSIKAGEIWKDPKDGKEYVAVLQSEAAENREKPCLSCAFSGVRLEKCPRVEYGSGFWWILCATAPDGEDILFKPNK